MPSLEQLGLPILIVGAIVTLIGLFWVMGVAFKTGFLWGLLLIFGHAVAITIAVLLLRYGFETPWVLAAGLIALVPYPFYIWKHLRRSWKPALVLIVGLGVLASPVAINSAMKLIPDTERERVVDGETHLTLTGLSGYDYATLANRTEVQVLQMANPDVTDDTLQHLAGMHKLKELDLNDTQITDAGLARLAQLPALEKLRLRNTKITDEGFRQHLFELKRLDELDVTGTDLKSKTVRAWKAAKEGRKALN